MPATKFTPSIISRPIYGGLTPHGAVPALMLASGPGGEALLDLIAADPAVLPHATVIYIPEGSDLGPRLEAQGPASYVEAASYASILPRFRKLLAEALMNTRLYLAGTEGLIGQATAEALAAGMLLEAIEAEHRGSLARRMQCVHCKGITEDVTTDPFTCSHCGLSLFVRDHYSRRYAAFQGVCVDAETPGEVPPKQEIKA
ncbi:dimethylamine monooxygenase subunit DmmA family protein [Paracoccus onubensis]|uniref:dimethylamine monooxygenase subunit DmmA family protein n=1 Tax=Paracoccus onubensis TaxID=1675788 RepID=UPI0027316687|nr:dimethylamine monooxygenase subunit DmmA family protein [Paracoccus onubensis]MDP0926360.1 dimethylamine monooxygenase subunit DmmA family protein [Paracoccus onubensis]